MNEDFVHEGLLGTRFVGRLVEETTVGDYAAVRPDAQRLSVRITGRAEYILDETDPLPGRIHGRGRLGVKLSAISNASGAARYSDGQPRPIVARRRVERAAP